MAVNRWWDADPAEIYWMEITGRDDLGANLAAPQTDERGGEYVGYTLVREVTDGDVVFHFDRPRFMTKSRIACLDCGWHGH